MSTQSCLIIGAGIAGLLAAKQLTAAGYAVTVLDKGRGVGGRMANRRFENARFDHGAQFFTVRDPQFAALVEEWKTAGIVEVWTTGFPTLENPSAPLDGHPRYRGVPRMTAIAKYLSASLDVHTSVQVTAVAVNNDQWHIQAEDGQAYTADTLIMTPPVPQSLALIDAGGVQLPEASRSALESIEYDPCFAVLAVLDKPSKIPAPGALQIRGEPIGWIADNKQKGVSPDANAVTIHAGPQFTRDHFDADIDEVARLLIDAAQEWLGSEPKAYQVQRWRYSQPIQAYPERCLYVDMTPPVIFAGDAFGGPRVEGASLSGLAAAAKLSG